MGLMVAEEEKAGGDLRKADGILVAGKGREKHVTLAQFDVYLTALCVRCTASR